MKKSKIKYYFAKNNELFNLEFFELKKGLFGKEKYIKVHPEEVFLSKDVENFLPRIRGISILQFLYKKRIYNLTHKISDFNIPVNFKINNYSENFEKILFEGSNIYIGAVNLEGSFYSNENEELVSLKLRIPIQEFFKPTKEILELLFSTAYSGKFASARQVSELQDYIEGCFNGSTEYKYYCNFCNERFNSLDELYSHIIETKHYDTILDEFPYDPEIIKIKKLINQ